MFLHTYSWLHPHLANNNNLIVTGWIPRFDAEQSWQKSQRFLLGNSLWSSNIAIMAGGEAPGWRPRGPIGRLRPLGVLGRGWFWWSLSWAAQTGPQKWPTDWPGGHGISDKQWHRYKYKCIHIYIYMYIYIYIYYIICIYIYIIYIYILYTYIHTYTHTHIVYQHSLYTHTYI